MTIVLITNILKAVDLLLIIPTRPAKALCRCSFFSLRRLKTYMRSNNDQEKLNSLILTACHTEKLKVIDNKKIAEEYCRVLTTNKYMMLFCRP